MDLYTKPFFGMHLVRATPVRSLGRIVLELARTMPHVSRQSKSMYFSWGGEPPVSGPPPVDGLRIDTAGKLSLAYIKEAKLDPKLIDAAIAWVEQQETSWTGAGRWLPVAEDDGYRHAAWIVSGATPRNKELGESPSTELHSICMADAIVRLSPHEQCAWIQRLSDCIVKSSSVWDYGYVEIGDWSEIVEGGAYRTTGNLMRWRQMLEYNVWQAHGMLPSGFKFWREKYPVKGVYWGNYFGPSILKRIGGAERLKAHIDERCREDPRNGWYRDMPGGALFLALSGRISDAQYELGGDPPMRAMANAVWLWSVLREANVMI